MVLVEAKIDDMMIVMIVLDFATTMRQWRNIVENLCLLSMRSFSDVVCTFSGQSNRVVFESD